MNPELTALREQIDEVDRQLVALFRQRMAISKIVAAKKGPRSAHFGPRPGTRPTDQSERPSRRETG